MPLVCVIVDANSQSSHRSSTIWLNNYRQSLSSSNTVWSIIIIASSPRVGGNNAIGETCRSHQRIVKLTDRSRVSVLSNQLVYFHTTNFQLMWMNQLWPPVTNNYAKSIIDIVWLNDSSNISSDNSISLLWLAIMIKFIQPQVNNKHKCIVSLNKQWQHITILQLHQL